jgi:hypothetical protein
MLLQLNDLLLSIVFFNQDSHLEDAIFDNQKSSSDRFLLYVLPVSEEFYLLEYNAL